MLGVESGQIAQLHLVIEGLILTRIGLCDGIQELTYLTIDRLTSLLGLRGIYIALTLEPLIEDPLIEALLIQYKIELGEEIVHAVGLATCLNPVDIFGDGEIDFHRAGA